MNQREKYGTHFVFANPKRNTLPQSMTHQPSSEPHKRRRCGQIVANPLTKHANSTRNVIKLKASNNLYIVYLIVNVLFGVSHIDLVCGQYKFIHNIDFYFVYKNIDLKIL